MTPARLFTRGFTLVWTASLLYNAAFQLIGAALPLFAVSLGAGDGQVGLLIGLFALAAMAGRTVVGWQLDRGAKRLVLVAGNLIFVVSALGYAAVTAVAPLLALRVLNGAGHAAGQAANQTLATETAPPERRGEALAMQLLTLTLAAVGMAAVAAAREWWLLPAAALFGLGVGFAQPSLIALAADRVPPAERGSAIATAGIFLEGGISAGATVAGLIGQAAGLPAAFLALGLLPALACLALMTTDWGRRTLRPPSPASPPAVGGLERG